LDLGLGQQQFGSAGFRAQTAVSSSLSSINISFGAGGAPLVSNPIRFQKKRKVTMTATLAGILYDEEPEAPKPARKPKPNPTDRFDGGPSTDIKAWLAANGPRNYDELTELRRALYKRDTYGNVTIKRHSNSWSGEQRFSVVGRESSLLIISDKSRHFLLRTLCRIKKQL
jgi:hypothetical protein